LGENEPSLSAMRKHIKLLLVALPLVSCQHNSPARYEELMALPPIMDQAGRRYVFPIDAAAIECSPRWLKRQEYPPLSPKSAVTAARKEAIRLRPDIKVWRLADISLQSLEGEDADLWCYVIVLSPADRALNGPPSTLEVPVMMDGRAIHGTTDWGMGRSIRIAFHFRSRALLQP
jgi:hypothetical protein